MAQKKTSKKEKPFDYKTIKSFEDACKRKGIDPTQLPVVLVPEIAKQLIAAYKLMVIFLAINDGWEADFNNWDQIKYYPWYRCLSSGFGFANSAYDSSHTTTTVGSRLCTNTSEKALYIADQFKAEYEDYILIKK
jgi:hypothetical protein